MNRNEYYNYIDKQLHILSHRIRTNGKLNILHIHLQSENFYLHLFNLLYHKNLKNLNDTSQNVEAIDLIDHDNKIMIQVSSTSTKQKIESSLSKKKLKEYQNYRFKFISIAKDATNLRDKIYKNPYSIKFDPVEDIYDIHSILKNILSLDIDTLKAIYNLIWKELGEEGINQSIQIINNDKVQVTQQFFKSYYREHFKNISFLINNNLKSIEDIYVNLSIIREKKEDVKDKSKLVSRESFLNSYEEIYKPKEPIDIEELIYKSKRSLIYGKAGIGKTTLCKYIAYMWANNKLYNDFEYIIYISLREWKKKGLIGAIKDNYYSQDENIRIIDIKENQHKILFLFDGYDELLEKKKKILKNEIKVYSLNNYIITSRPYGYVQNEFSIDEQFETIGFTKENVNSYIEKYFHNSKEGKALNKYLQNNINIKQITSIPLILEMICTLWKDKYKTNGNMNFPITLTELYSDIVDYILNKYSANKDDKRVYKRKNRRKIKEQLSKIAFAGLRKQIIFFNGDLIEDSIDDIDFFEDNVIYSGFLKSDTKEKDLLDNNFEFPHLTFQEYFAALYVSKLLKKDQKKIIKKYKFYSYMQIFFTFLTGLIKDKKFLLDKIKDKPRDKTEYYEFILLLSCFSEIEKIDIIGFNKSLSYWLKTTIYNDNHFKYKVLLDKLRNISKWLDINTINILLNIIKDENIKFYIKEEVAKFISQIKVENDDILYGLIELSTNNKIGFLDMVKIAFLLSNIKREDNRFINILIEIVKDQNIHFFIRGEITKIISRIERKDNEFIDSLMTLINVERIFITEKLEVIQALLKIKKYDVNSLVKLLKDEKIDDVFKIEVIKSLPIIKRENIDYLIKEIINKEMFSEFRKEIVKYLLKIERNDIEPLLIKIITDKKIDTRVKSDIAKTLASITRKSFIIHHLITNNENDIWIRKDISCSFLNSQKNNEQFIHNLVETLLIIKRSSTKFIRDVLKIVKNKKIIYIGEKIKESFLNIEIEIEIENDLIFNLIKSINKDNIYSYMNKKDDLKSLSNIKTGTYQYINNLVDLLIEDKKQNSLRWKLIELDGKKDEELIDIVFEDLLNTKKDDDLYIDNLINLIKNKKIDYFNIKETIDAISSITKEGYEFTDSVLKVVQDEKIIYRVSRECAKILLNINRNDNHFLDSLVSIIKNNKVDSFAKDTVINVLLKIHRNDNYFLDSLIEVINYGSISTHIEKILNRISNIKRNDDKFIDKLINFSKSEKIDTYFRAIVLESLSSIKRNDDRFLNKIISFLNDEMINYNIRVEGAKVLVSIKRDDNLFLNKILSFIQDETIHSTVRGEVTKTLLNINRNDSIFITSLIEIINNNKIHFYVKEGVSVSLAILASKDVSIFHKLDLNRDFSKYFIKNTSIESFFYAFDNKYIDLDKLIQNALYNTLPLYIKKNKLCTIYKNKEIKTQKEVSLEEIERVKERLGLSSI